MPYALASSSAGSCSACGVDHGLHAIDCPARETEDGLRGGQGRSPEDLGRDAYAFAIVVGVAILAAAAIVAHRILA